MLSNYMAERLRQKQGLSKTPQEVKAEQPKKGIAKQSAKKIEAEKQAKNGQEISLSQFFKQMIEKVPEKCMETGQPLTYKITPVEVVVHILPKRSVTNGGVPSQAKNPINIMYFNIDVHTAFDKDMGTKSNGKYVKQMKSYNLLKERVSIMWPSIKEEEKKNIPSFLKPE